MRLDNLNKVVRLFAELEAAEECLRLSGDGDEAAFKLLAGAQERLLVVVLREGGKYSPASPCGSIHLFKEREL